MFNWFYKRFIKKSNCVYIKTLKAGDWHDADDRLLHASFQILVEFMEEEIKNLPWREDLPIYKEVEELYKWWTEVRPARKDPIDAWNGTQFFGFLFCVPDLKTEKEKREFEEFKAVCDASNAFDEQYYEEDTAMLIRLMQIRGQLWT